MLVKLQSLELMLTLSVIQLLCSLPVVFFLDICEGILEQLFSIVTFKN